MTGDHQSAIGTCSAEVAIAQYAMGILRRQQKSFYPRRADAHDSPWRRSVRPQIFFSLTAMLLTVPGSLVLAQTESRSQGTYAAASALTHSAIAVHERVVPVIAPGTADPVRLATSSMSGPATATKPWPAPVGHRQPRATDIPASAPSSQQMSDPEDANIDRIIKGICRGC